MTARKNIWAGVVPALFIWGIFFSSGKILAKENFSFINGGKFISEKIFLPDTLPVPPEEKISQGDTIPRRPLGMHGQMLMRGTNNTYRTIAKENFLFQNYSDLAEIFSFRLPAYPLHLGSEGQFNHFSFFGATPRDIDFRLNGRSINDPAFGAFHLEQMPPEMIDRAEVFVGTDAAVFGGTAGALINIRQNVYNINRPYTRLWYVQGGYDLSGSDGIFAQNFARDWNFSFGFRRLANNGRYVNTNLDNWNVRAALRWAPTNRLTVTLSDFFTNHRTGTNGGIDPVNSEDRFNELLASPYYSYMDERVFRHDVTLSAVAQLDADSLSFLNTTLYWSGAEWYKGRPADFVLRENNMVEKFYSEKAGARIQFEQGITEYFTLRAGGDAEIRNIEESDYTEGLKDVFLGGFGHGEIKLSDRLRVRGGLRIGLEQEKIVTSLGIATNISFGHGLSLLVDLSRLMRLPTPSEGLGLSAEQHTLALTELQWQNSLNKIFLTAFTRNIGSPILSQAVSDSSKNRITTRSENAASRRILGASLTASSQIFRNFTIEGFVLAQQSTTNAVDDERFPLLTGKISAQYEYRIGESVVIAGTSYTLLTPFKGEQFVPQRWAYVPYDKQTPISGSWDIFLSLRLGNAFIRASYLNLLSQEYYFVPVYPQYDRNFRLSIAWSFFD